MTIKPMSRRPRPRDTCRFCGKNVATYVPKGGDGTPFACRHNATPGVECRGSRWEIDE